MGSVLIAIDEDFSTLTFWALNPETFFVFFVFLQGGVNSNQNVSRHAPWGRRIVFLSDVIHNSITPLAHLPKRRPFDLLVSLMWQ